METFNEMQTIKVLIQLITINQVILEYTLYMYYGDTNGDDLYINKGSLYLLKGMFTISFFQIFKTFFMPSYNVD